MSDIRISVAEGVMELTLARAAKKNALTLAMYADLDAALVRADADPDVRCVLIAAEGADFCAGNDLNDFMGLGGAAVDPDGPILRFLHRLADLQTPLAAAVQGRAVGVGATLLLHCDLVAAAPDANLIMPFVKLGLVPEAGSSQLLPALVGRRVAAEMLLLGRPVGAERALSLGLINEIDADPLGAARALAQEAARQAPGALVAARKLMRRQGDTLHERIDAEGAVFVERLATPEFQSMAMAFFQRK